MNQLLTVLALVAAVILGSAFCVYAKQTKLGASTPNIATWGISVFLAILNALTLRGMFRGQEVIVLQAFVSFAGAVAILSYSLVRGQFSTPGRNEVWSLVLGIAASYAWYTYRSATYANMIVVFAVVVAMAPTLYGVYKNPFKETSLAWNMWATAYVLMAVNVVLSKSSNPKWSWILLVNPVVYAFVHALAAWFSRGSRKQAVTKRYFLR